MKPQEYNNRLTGLTERISGLKDRRPSAGRWHTVMGIVADVEEMVTMLEGDVVVKVSREIVLDADEGIDYAVLGDTFLSLLPVELLKATADEAVAMQRLNEAVEELAALLQKIADLLDRRHDDEEYIKLYDDELKRYMRYWGNSTRREYKEFSEGDCLGMPTMEELENYRAEKMMHLFETGIFGDSVAHKRSARRYPDEVALPLPDSTSNIAEKDVHKHYFCLRKVCDYKDGCLVVNPIKSGIYFFVHRKDKKAKDRRNDFLKYMMKIDLAQQDMTALRVAKENAMPRELGTAEAMCYWQRLLEKGFVEKDFKLATKTTRKQAMYIAESFAEKLGLRSKWKLFQEFWGINGLAQEKWEMQQTGTMPTRYKEIDEIFKD